MISTVSIYEMNLIVNCEHKDPHTVLGMHEVLHDDREVVAVRAFLPGAKELYVMIKTMKTPFIRLTEYTKTVFSRL